MEALSKYIPIIYLDGSRDARGKVTRNQISEQVTVVRGLLRQMVSFKLRGYEQPSYAWGWWHTRWIRRKYSHIIFMDSENWLRPYRFIPHDSLVFDCIDPCFDRSPAVLSDFETRELQILRASQAVFATADSLIEFARKHNNNVTLLNNACSPGEYSPELVAEARKPKWWPTAVAPIAAYLGAIDWRFDFDFAVQAAKDQPGVSFVFAGNMLAEVKGKSKPLTDLPNVCMAGSISVEEGRYLLAHCDIGLIPFKMGEMNDAINPVKMYAYAYLGKPIAGSAVRELASRPTIADVGRTPVEFSAAITAALDRANDPSAKATLQAFAAENTWEKRAEQAWKVLEKL
jgi:glycosyltransferase involved in cell wall biosynthesis